VILDAAHNPAGARALAEALPELAAGRPVTACVAVLADKDAEGIVSELAPAITALVATELPAPRLAAAGRPGATALASGELAAFARAAGVRSVAEEPDPSAAIALGRSLAQEARGVLVVCGSHYLLGYCEP
jgi:dihydrofolate synthase/folylpolyglutamate synthase